MRTDGAWNPFGYTHDLLTPRRADVEDLGGEENKDDDPAPMVGIEPAGSVTNEQNRHIAGLERVGTIARLWVQFVGGTPTIVKVAAMGRRVVTTTFTVSHPSTGVVDIFWPAAALAPQEADPWVVAMAKLAFFAVQHPSPPSGMVGVQVTGWTTHTGTLTDGNFAVSIH